jgi:hypothetical protein
MVDERRGDGHMSGRAGELGRGGDLGRGGELGGGDGGTPLRSTTLVVSTPAPGPPAPTLATAAPQLPRSPQPKFEVTAAAPLAHAAAPTLVFSCTVSDPSGLEIHSISLSVQVMIDPARRGYDPRTRERLAELFGPPASWAPSTQGLAWGRVATVVSAFTGSGTFALELPCTYDLEVAATKYFYALSDGEVPLSFHFNGAIFYRGTDGPLQVTPIPWSATAQFRMPVAVWRATIARHYPRGGWIRLSDDTLAALNARRAARGLPSFDACVAELLERRDEPDA